MNSWAGLLRVQGEATTREAGSSEVTEFPTIHQWGYKDDQIVDMTISIWGKRGKTAESIIKPGDLIFVTGEQTFRVYKDKTYVGLQVSNYKKVSGGKPALVGAGAVKSSGPPIETTDELDAEIPF